MIVCDACGATITRGVYYRNREALPVCPACWPVEQAVDARLDLGYQTAPGRLPDGMETRAVSLYSDQTGEK